MHIIRTLATRFSYAILPILLFTFGLSWSLYMVFGTPQPLEHALKQSGIYSIAAQNTLQGQESTASIPLSNPGVQDAIQRAFPPELLEQNTNKIIDGTYAWVQGTTASPDFAVDVTGSKTNLANYVAEYVLQRSKTLPICTRAQLSSLSSVDPYNATCRPATTSSEAIAEQAKQQVLASDILSNPVLTADSIKNSDGKTLSQQLEIVPQAYSWTIRAMYGTGIIALVCIGLIIWLQWTDWRWAVKRLAIIAFSVGFLSAGLAWAVSFGFDKLASTLAEGATSELLQTKITAIITELATDVKHWWFGYGVGLIVLAIIGWVLRKVIKQPVAPTSAHPAIDHPSLEPELKPAGTSEFPQNTHHTIP